METSSGQTGAVQSGRPTRWGHLPLLTQRCPPRPCWCLIGFQVGVGSSRPPPSSPSSELCSSQWEGKGSTLCIFWGSRASQGNLSCPIPRGGSPEHGTAPPQGKRACKAGPTACFPHVCFCGHTQDVGQCSKHPTSSWITPPLRSCLGRGAVIGNGLPAPQTTPPTHTGSLGVGPRPLRRTLNLLEAFSSLVQ